MRNVVILQFLKLHRKFRSTVAKTFVRIIFN